MTPEQTAIQEARAVTERPLESSREIITRAQAKCRQLAAEREQRKPMPRGWYRAWGETKGVFLQ